MAKSQELTYETLERPYNSSLERSEQGIIGAIQPSSENGTSYVNSTGGDGSGSGTTINDPNQIKDGAISGSALTDIWLESWMKSRNYKPKSQGFLIDGQRGYIECMELYVGSGGIIGGSLDIPDITTANSFHVATNGDTWWGTNKTTGYATAPAYILSTGVAKFTSGTVGGCVLATTSIGSTTFVSGPLGSGWNISNTGTAEFQDCTIRGTIRTSVFEKDTMSCVNGIVLISSADTLDADMTAADDSTVTISGQTTFSANEVIRIKDGTDDEWMLVTNTASAPTYVVTRDLAGSYGANANPAWKTGTAVVSMGVGTGTKTGFILMDSSSANSPYIDIYGRNSNTYSDYTLHARLGWLKGITDANVGLNSTDVWGLYSDSVYLTGTINATAGKFGTSTNYWNVGATGLTATSTSTDVIINYGKTDFGQDSTAGFILGYDYSASKAKLEFGSSATKLFVYDGVDLTLTGGTITGGTIQTATSGKRIEMSSDTLSIYTGNLSGATYLLQMPTTDETILLYSEGTSRAMTAFDNPKYAYTGIELIDSYSETNQDSDYTINNVYSAGGQSFTAVSAKITSCKFYLKKANSPTGNCYAKLYSHTGTYGTNGLPDTLLAISDAFDVSTLTTSYALITFTFTGTEQYVMGSGTHYFIVFEYTAGDSSNTVLMGRDITSQSHSGNFAIYSGGGWATDLWVSDGCFYVYGNLLENTTTADIIKISAGEGSGKALNIIDNGTTRTDELVGIQSSIGTALHVKNSGNSGGALVKLSQLDQDKTCLLISNDATPTADNNAVVEIESPDSDRDIHSLLQLTGTGQAHITFGGTGPSSPAAGDFWFDGTNLKIRVGATTYTLDKTAV